MTLPKGACVPEKMVGFPSRGLELGIDILCWLSVPHGVSKVVSSQQTPEGVVSDKEGELIGSPCGTARV